MSDLFWQSRWERVAYHVQIEECNPEAKVVLVEHSLELMVQEGSALSEPDASPRIESSTLELYFS
jgi:hypothetical protein